MSTLRIASARLYWIGKWLFAKATTLPLKLSLALDKKGGTFALRLAWILWLSSFLVLYACPAFVAWLADGDRLIPPTQPWSWDWEVWLPTILACIVPAALHRRLLKSINNPYGIQRDITRSPQDYRSAHPLMITLCRGPAQRRITLYAGRLGLAMALSFMPFHILMHSRFTEFQGCVGWSYMRSLNEHFGWVSLLFAVAFFHIPLKMRIYGTKPSRSSLS